MSATAAASRSAASTGPITSARSSPSTSARPSSSRSTVRDHAEHPFHQHRPRHLRAGLGPPARVVDDANRVTPHGGRQHVAGRVADEVELRQPAERLADPLRGEQHLPSPRHRPGRGEQDRQRRDDVERVRLRDLVDDLGRVELPEQEGEDPAADGQLDGDARGAPAAAAAAVGAHASRRRRRRNG